MYNNQFLAAPHVFANNHTLYPSADPAVNQGQMRQLSLSDGTSFTQVQGQNKVAWCNIEPAGNFPNGVSGDGAGDYSQDQNLLIMRVTFQRTATAFPVYYLPWAPDSMFRIKLKPSPNHPTQTGIIFKDTVEPEVFITAALQGCSIIVSGDQQQPVVYHLNAQSTQGPLGEDVGTANNDQDFGISATAKRQHMLARYNMARTERPKEGPQAFGVHPLQTYNSQAAHLTDYMHGMRPSNQQPLQQRYLGAAQGLVGQFGTVFGIRSGGNWKFYRQTRTRVYRYGPPNGMGGFADTASWEDPVCVRFWP